MNENIYEAQQIIRAGLDLLNAPDNLEADSWTLGIAIALNDAGLLTKPRGHKWVEETTVADHMSRRETYMCANCGKTITHKTPPCPNE